MQRPIDDVIKIKSNTFQQEISSLIGTSDYKIQIEQTVLDDPIWEMLKFTQCEAKKIYSNIKLLNKISPGTLFHDDLIDEKLNKLGFTTKFQTWQLFLLAGGKLPLSNGYSPDSDEAKRFKILESDCLKKKDNWDRTPYHYAMLAGNKNTVSHFWRFLTQDSPDKNYLWGQQYQLYSGVDIKFSPEEVRKFTIEDNAGRKMLHHAVIAGNLNLVKHFSHQLNEKTKNGRLPLHYAVYYDHEHIVDFIIQKDSSTSISDLKGRNLLFYAACSSESMWDFIFSKFKSSVNKVDEAGNNVLMFIIDQRRWQLFQKLLDSKLFDLNHKNKQDKTALDLIVHTDKTDYAESLIQAGAKISPSTFYYAVSTGSEKMVAYLVSKGFRAYLDRSYLGKKPLEVAPSEQQIINLLTLGADPRLVSAKTNSKAIEKALADRLIYELMINMEFFTPLYPPLSMIIIDYCLANLDETPDPGITLLKWKSSRQKHQMEQGKWLTSPSLRTGILLPLRRLMDGECYASEDSVRLATDLYGELIGENNLLKLAEALKAGKCKVPNKSGLFKTGASYINAIEECLKNFEFWFPEKLKCSIVTDPPEILPSSSVQTTRPPTPIPQVLSQVSIFQEVKTSSLMQSTHEIKINVDLKKVVELRKALKAGSVYQCLDIFTKEQDGYVLIEYYKAAFIHLHAQSSIDPNSQNQTTTNAGMIFSSILTRVQEKDLLDSAKKALTIDLVLNGLLTVEVDEPTINALLDLRHKQVTHSTSSNSR